MKIIFALILAMSIVMDTKSDLELTIQDEISPIHIL